MKHHNRNRSQQSLHENEVSLACSLINQAPLIKKVSVFWPVFSKHRPGNCLKVAYYSVKLKAKILFYDLPDGAGTQSGVVVLYVHLYTVPGTNKV
jgi:hypothetical protein